MVGLKRSKFKTTLVRENREKTEFETQQQKLKQKHRIQAPDGVIVVERRNLLRILAAAVRLLSTVLLFALAAEGVTALLDAASRAALLEVFDSLMKQIGMGRWNI